MIFSLDMFYRMFAKKCYFYVPPEILLHIISYLDDDSLYSLNFVNRAFRNVITEKKLRPICITLNKFDRLILSKRYQRWGEGTKIKALENLRDECIISLECRDGKGIHIIRMLKCILDHESNEKVRKKCQDILDNIIAHLWKIDDEGINIIIHPHTRSIEKIIGNNATIGTLYDLQKFRTKI